MFVEGCRDLGFGILVEGLGWALGFSAKAFRFEFWGYGRWVQGVVGKFYASYDCSDFSLDMILRVALVVSMSMAMLCVLMNNGGVCTC